MTAPGIVLSHPTSTTSRRSCCRGDQFDSNPAMTSRLTERRLMPAVPIGDAVPSMETGLNSRGVRRGANAALTSAARSFRW